MCFKIEFELSLNFKIEFKFQDSIQTLNTTTLKRKLFETTVLNKLNFMK